MTFINIQHEETGRVHEWDASKPIPHGYARVSEPWPAEIWVDTDLVGDYAPHEGWEKYTRENKLAPAITKLAFAARREKAEIAIQYEALYDLVELYLTTSPAHPKIMEHYDNLCAWFVRNKRPDGTEPRPIAKESYGE